MRGTCGRRFNVADALILIAATALAIAATRTEFVWPVPSEPPRSYSAWLNWIRWCLYLVSYFVATWSMAFLILRLRQPRPALRRLVRQPGMVACTAASVVLGIRLINLLTVGCVVGIDLSKPTGWDYVSSMWTGDESVLIPSEIGCAVAAAWTIQIIGGRWRPEPCWIDRAGRLLGAFWIATTPFSWFSFMTG